MKRRLKIIYLGASGIVVALIIALASMYLYYYIKHEGNKPYFDLFIAETFFEVEGTVHDHAALGERIPITWKINGKDFNYLDKIKIELTNSSSNKLYYTTWGAPLSRLQQDLIIYHNDSTDTIWFAGYGCATGVYVEPLPDEESIIAEITNPLMFHPKSNWDLPIHTDSFPEVFKGLYGDSVAIRFGQPMYSPPWNKYKSQTVNSDYYVVNTDSVLANWTKTLPQQER